MSEPTSPIRNPNEDIEEPVTPEPVTPDPVTPESQLIRNDNSNRNIISQVFGTDDQSDIDTDTSAGEEEMEELERRTAGREGPRTRLDFGDEAEDSQPDRELSKKITPCEIPDEIKAMRPTISDQVEFMDIIDGEEKTIKQHLEEVEEEGELPDNVIFMNEQKNQFVAIGRDDISKLIDVKPEQDAKSGIFFKCKKTMEALSLTPNDVEYVRPYFDLRSIGYIPGGYVDLKCFLEIYDIESPHRVFMVVEPKNPIDINPVANELSITTHRYQVITTEKIIWYDGKPEEVISTNTENGEGVNVLDMPIDMVGAAHCQEGQFSKLVYLVPVEVISAEEPVPSAEEPQGEKVESRGGKRKRKGKKTLRKKNLLKKKKNKTKRKKSKK